MIVLSVFDGMSCGQLALQRAGHKVEKYYSSEIDKYAIAVTQKNFPDTIQLGDITKVKACELDKIDLLIGGSPCQGFSFAGKQLNFEDPRSALFFEFVRLWKEIVAINPDAKFLLENVKMKKEYELIISNYMGVAPVEINSALVSAQNRVRLYWTNIAQKPYGLFGELFTDIPQPKDRGIMLKDILEDNVAEKFYLSETAMARINRKVGYVAQLDPDKTGTLNTKNNSGQLSVDHGTTLITDRGVGRSVQEDDSGKVPPLRASSGASHDNKILKIDIDGNLKSNQDKVNALTIGGHGAGNHSDMDLMVMVQKGHGFNKGGEHTDKSTSMTSSAWQQNNHIHSTRIRRLTPVECERLQTVPDNYTACVSDTQRYRMLGNGWTIEVIAYIFGFYTI